jgi:hypothetical protein
VNKNNNENKNMNVMLIISHGIKKFNLEISLREIINVFDQYESIPIYSTATHPPNNTMIKI